MDNANVTQKKDKTLLSKKSWVAYIFPAFIILIAVAFYFKFSFSYSYLVALAILLKGVYLLFLNKSYELFINETGVWVFSGIFPWSRGVNGVKWRDLDEAVYYTGFVSWLTRSYTVRISHRFTKGSEIVLSHMQAGGKAVEKINALHDNIIAKSENIQVQD